MKTSYKVLFATLFVFALTACSDGGRDINGKTTASVPPPVVHSTQNAPEGAYTGKSLSGNSSTWDVYGGPDIETIVLEDGRVYMFFGAKDRYGVMSLNGFGSGVGSVINGNFIVPHYFDQRNGKFYSGVLGAGYNLGGFTGNRTEDATYSFMSDPTAIGVYNYHIPADMNRITGSWTMTSSRALPGIGLKPLDYLNILGNGNVAGQMSGCAVSGIISPRSSGKNVFDVALSASTYSGPFGCPSAANIIKGIAFVQTLPAGNQLFIAVSDGTDMGTLVSSGFR